MEPEEKKCFYGSCAFTLDEQYPPTTAVKKKKPPKNAFFFYMQDFREAQETKGILYKTQKEVADAASSSWQHLSHEERKPYQDLAKEAKEKDKLDLHNKFTTEGKSYAEVNKEEQEQRKRQENMLHEIQNTIKSLRTQPALSNYPFHMVHVNYYCKTTSGLYIPCELAISEFSLQDGVKRLFHVLINPGDLPLGYRYEAEKQSEETHRIPLPPELQFDGVITDYAKIYQCVLSFLREAKAVYKPPPLYTITSQLEPCENVLTMLSDSVNESNIFRVYPAQEMFFKLQHACVEVFKPADENIVKFPFVSLAERELEKDVFDYTKGISCHFHEDTDSIPFCSLSSVQRWGFLVLAYCHKVTNMALIPGKHMPQHANVSQFKKSRALQKKSDETQKLNTTMQNLHISSRNTTPSGMKSKALQRERRAKEHTGTLRAPKQASEAIRLLLPDDSDELRTRGINTTSDMQSEALDLKRQLRRQTKPLRAPRQISEAINLLLPDGSDDELCTSKTSYK